MVHPFRLCKALICILLKDFFTWYDFLEPKLEAWFYHRFVDKKTLTVDYFVCFKELSLLICVKKSHKTFIFKGVVSRNLELEFRTVQHELILPVFYLLLLFSYILFLFLDTLTCGS